MRKDVTITVTDSDGQEVALRRRQNPDGSIGGLVADNAEVPPGLYVPFNSMVAPGACVAAGEVIPEAVIIDRAGKRYPNAPSMT
jgi:hypothetical protein